MASDLLRYDLLVQDALRSVVRKVLVDAARDGLPGDHHFYITFRTQAPGVRLSQRNREQYPQEMTIILQHQFWDLSVDDIGFEVGLSFSGKAERLMIPFEAITGFFDPSVQFGLKFELQDEELEEGANDVGDPEVPVERPAPKLTPAPAPLAEPAKARPRGSASEPTEVPAPEKAAAKPAAKPALKPVAEKVDAPKDEAAPSGDSKVVSIDAFRKKP